MATFCCYLWHPADDAMFQNIPSSNSFGHGVVGFCLSMYVKVFVFFLMVNSLYFCNQKLKRNKLVWVVIDFINVLSWTDSNFFFYFLVSFSYYLILTSNICFIFICLNVNNLLTLWSCYFWLSFFYIACSIIFISRSTLIIFSCIAATFKHLMIIKYVPICNRVSNKMWLYHLATRCTVAFFHKCRYHFLISL